MFVDTAVAYYHRLRNVFGDSVLRRESRTIDKFAAHAKVVDLSQRNPGLVQRIEQHDCLYGHTIEDREEIDNILSKVLKSVSWAAVPWFNSKLISGSEYNALYSPNPLGFLVPMSTTGDGNCWLEAFFLTAQDRGVDFKHDLPSGNVASKFQDFRRPLSRWVAPARSQ